jgi:hypothetical protein
VGLPVLDLTWVHSFRLGEPCIRLLHAETNVAKERRLVVVKEVAVHSYKRTLGDFWCASDAVGILLRAIGYWGKANSLTEYIDIDIAVLARVKDTLLAQRLGELARRTPAMLTDTVGVRQAKRAEALMP